MHRASPLQRLPPEIFYMILKESLDGYSGYDRTTAARLARTCRDFLQPSLDIIWKRIPHIAVLFYLLPRDMWTLWEVASGVDTLYSMPEMDWDEPPRTRDTQTVVYTVELNRPLIDGDLDRILKEIAPRVKTVESEKRGTPRVRSNSIDFTHWTVSESSVKALLAYLGPDRYLFPRLVEYDFWTSNVPIRYVDGSNHPQPFHRLLGPAVQHITTKSDNDWAPASRSSSQNISITLLNLHGLTTCSLYTHPLSLDVFRHLGSLPTLKEFAAVVPLQTVQNGPFLRPSTDGAPFFPALRKLTLCHPDETGTLYRLPSDSSPGIGCITVLHAVILAITSRELENITLNVDRPDPQQLARLFGALGTRASTGAGAGAFPLRELAVEIRASDPYAPWSAALTDRAFAPLLALRGLRNLALVGPLPVAISDGMVERMARAWPELRELDLECVGSVTDGMPTPRALLYLAEHCPKLWVLGLNLDLQGFAESEWEKEWDGEEHLELRCFDSVVSTIEAAAVEPFTHFIGSVFPCIESFETFSRPGWDPEGVDAVANRARWLEVKREYQEMHGFLDAD